MYRSGYTGQDIQVRIYRSGYTGEDIQVGLLFYINIKTIQLPRLTTLYSRSRSKTRTISDLGVKIG